MQKTSQLKRQVLHGCLQIKGRIINLLSEPL